jgi:hypothetical protein
MSTSNGRKPHPETSPLPCPPQPLPGAAPTPCRSAKILDRHLDRLSVVYIRQSSPHQVLHNRESRERQYALVDRAVALGWSRQRVLVIDEDQGQSGKTATQRSGFHRLLAEVTIAHVGLVLGLKMSRLARSSKDWHQLLEMCALVGIILADEDGVYDPNDSNDRLLLGLKGTISEFELVNPRNRSAGENSTADALEIAQRWKVFQRDRLPAYISWERYLANMERLRQNRSRADTKGTPRAGVALLAGLIRCGTCGCRLQVSYGRKQQPSYCCTQHLHKGIATTCHGLKAEQVDELLTQQVLLALQPAALELSVQALQEIDKERATQERHWQQRLERARYDSREAERRYRAVDPDNRLVARTLERR